MRCIDVKKDNKENKACNLMMYLVLNHHGEKAMLKNPRDFSKKGSKKAERKSNRGGGGQISDRP